MSTFNPSTGVIDTTITPQHFFRADMLALTDGTAVAAVDDAGGGNQWVQPTTGRQPLFKTSIFGAKPSLLFDGVDDNLSRAPAAPSNYGTLICLLKPTADVTTTSAASAPLVVGVPTTGNLFGLALGSATGSLTDELVTVQWTQLNRSAWTQTGGSLTAAAPHVLAARWDSATTRYFITHDNGPIKTSAVTGTPALINEAVARLGATGLPQFPFGGHIGLVLIYAEVLTDAQLSAVYAELVASWGATPPPPPPPPPSKSSTWSDHFVDVKDFGAVGDYVVATGLGTDNTAAIQAAIDSTSIGGANEGKVVLLSAGRYKTTGPLVLRQGQEICAPPLLRTTAIGSQPTTWGSVIEFYGGPNDNAIQAVGTITSASRVAVHGFRIVDRRTSPTGGCGVYFEEVVNQTVIKHMDIYGFPTGASVRITATSGNASDCVEVSDIWALGAQYAVDLSRIDNMCLISDIKIDTPSTAPMLSGIRVSGASPKIWGIKHENQKATCNTIELAAFYLGTVIDNIISRVGNGGPVVAIDDNLGSGVTIRGIQRQLGGVLLQTTVNSISGTRLPFWVGGSDGIWINGAQITGQYDIWGLLKLPSAVQIGSAPPTGRLGFYGATTVPRPTLTYSRAGESTADAQLRAALASLGLVTDSTTA